MYFERVKFWESSKWVVFLVEEMVKCRREVGIEFVDDEIVYEFERGSEGGLSGDIYVVEGERVKDELQGIVYKEMV